MLRLITQWNLVLADGVTIKIGNNVWTFWLRLLHVYLIGSSYRRVSS